jgi:hypothetical protein
MDLRIIRRVVLLLHVGGDPKSFSFDLTILSSGYQDHRTNFSGDAHHDEFTALVVITTLKFPTSIPFLGNIFFVNIHSPNTTVTMSLLLKIVTAVSGRLSTSISKTANKVEKVVGVVEATKRYFHLVAL